MRPISFVFEPYPLNDVVPWRLLNAMEIADIALEQNDSNVLAMIFFIVKHADAQARAMCEFVTFPPPRQVDFTSKE